jgi:hypothetical protein
MCHGGFSAFLTPLTVIRPCGWQKIPVTIAEIAGREGEGKKSPVRMLGGSADFQICCIAGFQVGRA